MRDQGHPVRHQAGKRQSMGIVRSPVNSRLNLNFGFGVVSDHAAMPSARQACGI